MRKIIYSNHALEQMEARGASRFEIEETLLKGEKIPAKRERQAYRLNFQYNNIWAGKFYAIKLCQLLKQKKTELLLSLFMYSVFKEEYIYENQL